MSKPKKIDLNDYEQVVNKDDMNGYSGLIIVPKKSTEGIQLPEIYFRRKSTVDLIENIEEAIWHQNVRIAITGTDADYHRRVDWWVENALNDEDWRGIINQTFNQKEFNVKASMEKAIHYLKTIRIASKRKSFLHKFFWNWFLTGFNWQLQRLEKGK